MDKSAILGIALSILVLVIYQELVSRFYPAPSTPPTPPTVKRRKAVRQNPREAPSDTKIPESAAELQPAPAKSAGEQAARDFKVETENYVALFTTQGARLKSFKFKKYRASAADNSAPFEMVQAAQDVPLPLGVSLASAGSRLTMRNWFTRRKAVISS